MIVGRGVVLMLVLCCSTIGAGQASNPAQQYFEAGEKAIAENRLDAAAQAYESLTRVEPKLAEAHAKLGLIYYMQGRFAEAAPQFRTALRLKPQLENADVLLAVCYSELSRYAEALPGLEKGFRHPADDKTRRVIGLELQRSFIGLNQLDKAAQTAIELSHLYPDDPEILYHAGRIFGDLAYSWMKRLTSVAPDSVWVRQAAGEAHEIQQHYDLAIAEYRKVIALEPNRPGIHFRLGRTLLSRPGEPGFSEEALREFQREYELDPTNSRAAYEIGEIYRKSGQLEKAGELFAIAVRNQPDFEEGQIGLARVLIELNRPAQALEHLQQAVRVDPENEVARYQLALVYKALGNAEAHAKELEQFRRLRDAKKQQQSQLSQGPLPLSDVTRQTLDPEPK